jgi:hypothetical protein
MHILCEKKTAALGAAIRKNRYICLLKLNKNRVAANDV